MSGRVVVFGWAESVHVRRWVTGLSHRGYQIRLISLGGEPVKGVETVVLPRRGPFPYWSQAARAVALAREFRPDIVHVHYAGGFGYWGGQCDFAPVIVSVWGADVVDLPCNPVYGYFIKRALKHAKLITATSDFLRRITVELLTQSEDRIEVIPFGVEVPAEPLPLPEGPVRLCFIKMHRRKYGPDILLRAFALARSGLPELRLTMAGEGDMTPRLRRLATELGIEDAVDFIGFVPNDRVYSLLEEHHIMVMPSVMESESFGVAVLEAAACARPVIASRVGGVPEVLRDGETGLLVPPSDVNALADAIAALAGDMARCRAMGNAGHRMVRADYRWKRSLDMMDAVYRKWIDG